MSYILKSLNQNQYWKPRSIGYTHDLNETGAYHYEVAYNHCRSINTNGKVNLIMIPSEDKDKIENGTLSTPNKQQDKIRIEDVIKSMGNTNSLETNPISLLFKTLNENNYYPEVEHDQLKYFGRPISYGETFEANLKIHGEYNNQKERAPLFIKASIYRKDNGLYELVSYPNYGKPENKNKTKLKI
jgi:hypothetical protein